MSYDRPLELGAVARPRRATSPQAGTWRRALLPSWPLIVGLLAFAQVVMRPLFVLADPDSYLHIAAGRWIWLHRALPFHDPFSYTRAGAPWVVHEWLAEVALAGAYHVAGWSGLVLLTAAAFALAMAFLMRRLLDRLGALPALILVFLAAALVHMHLLARPNVLVLPIMILWSGGLLEARGTGKGPPLALLPGMILWANLHGSFMFGVALAAFFGGEAVLFPAAGASRAAEARRWGIFLGLSVAAALMTPNGFAGLMQPFRIVAMPVLQSSINEWKSPDFQQFPALEAWFLGLTALGWLSGIKMPLPRLLLLLGLCHMTLQHGRFAEILGPVGALVIAESIGGQITAWIAQPPDSALSRATAWLARPARPVAFATTLALAALLSLPLARHPIVRKDGWITPGKALAFAARRGLLKKPVLNSYSFGGYLIFRHVKPAIDGRAELYGNAFIVRYFKAEAGNRKVLARLLKRYRVGWTLFSTIDNATYTLATLPGWREVYRDRYAVIDARVPGATGSLRQ